MTALPTREEWDAWRAHPVTEAVSAAFVAAAARNKQAWVDASWGIAPLNAAARDELFVRADAYLALSEMNYDNVMTMLGETK